MRYVFVTIAEGHDITLREPPDLCQSALANMHVDFPVKNDKHFISGIAMPAIWFIRPVQAHRRLPEIGEKLAAPSVVCAK